MTPIPLRLGCIADDFTGATDLANNLVRAGMRVVQTIGVPDAPLTEQADAVVVSLKSRTIPAADAVAQSLQALAWLRAQGAGQIYFKVCSTFDSTPAGNIGPVTEALMDALGCDFVVATPAFPDTGRSVFMGHLFVGQVLLHESGMQDHPLTPMTDPNLVRVLQAQCRRRVGLLERASIVRGPQAIAERCAALRAQGVGIAIADAIDNEDLLRLGAGVAGLGLLTAGSGLAIGLPANHGIAPSPQAATLPAPGGHRAILSGSCSRATNGQVADFIAAGGAAWQLDPQRLAADPDAVLQQVLDWAAPRLAAGPLLVYSTAEPQALRQVQERLGVQAAGTQVEQALGRLAVGLARLGVGQLVVAGGETSGAVVQALGMRQLRIGAQIDPGVPWCAGQAEATGRPLHIALKSGNFGSPDFFRKAFAALAA